METNTIHYVQLIILIGGVLMDLVALGARTALRHANLARLLHFRELREPNAVRTLALLERMPHPYAGLHIMQSLCRFLVMGLVFLLLQADARLESWIGIIGWMIVGGLILAWLEWVVERRVMRDPEGWLFRWNGFIRVSTSLFAPLSSLSLLLSREKSPSGEVTTMVTEDDLKTLVDVGQQDGVLEQEESKMIQAIFRLGDTLTREIMVPRIDVQALEIGTSLSDAVDTLLKTGFSRLPVYEETIDNILGLLYAKDLLQIWRDGNEYAEIRQELLRKAYFVPEAKKVDELLGEMQGRHVHMAIVVDEYGGVAGLVTLEDIIEEIFGEIQDEYDEEEQPYIQVDDGEYIFRGRIDLDDFNEIMDCDLPSNDADTLSGFIYTRLGHVPEVGERVAQGDLLLTVEQVTNHRIRKVRAQRIGEAAEPDQEQ